MPERSYNLPDGVVVENITYTPIYGAPPPADKTVESVGRRYWGSYKGDTTPNFNEKLAKGEFLPFKYYQRFDMVENRPHGTYVGTYDNGSKGYTYSQNPARSVEGQATSIEECEERILELGGVIDHDALLQRALADAKPDLDLLTLLAEKSKVIDLLVGARKRAGRLIKQARDGGHESAKSVSKSWLEWHYGWGNLYRDLQDILEVLQHPIRGEIVQGRAGNSFEDEVLHTRHDLNYYVSYDKETKIKRSLSVRGLVSLRHDISAPNILFNPVITFWEITPFSWVIDWFISIGTALQAWTNLWFVREETYAVSYKYVEESTMDITNPVLGTGSNATAPFEATGRATCRTTYKVRYPVGRPSLLPKLRYNVGWENLLDAAALVATRLK